MQRDYPSALDAFDNLIDRAKDKKIALFLDYDGTLSPIVDDPDSAFMSEAVSIVCLLVMSTLLVKFSLISDFSALSFLLAQMRATVRSVAKYFPTAIISGRSRDQVSKQGQ